VTFQPFIKIKTTAVEVGDRFRKEPGDIPALAESIRERGLLQPIVVVPAAKPGRYRLVAGWRRLEAFQRLGWTLIPAHVFQPGREDAVGLLKAERDENICRKNFTPSEAVALGKALEELERPKAKARQAQAGPAQGAGKKASGSGKFPEPLRGQVRDRVAEAVGMSGRTYVKAKTVVAAAEQEPQKYGPAAAEMDRTGNVDRAYKTVRPTLQNDPSRDVKGKPLTPITASKPVEVPASPLCALEKCKQLIRRLDDRDREALRLWLFQGMLD
jgi:hypothetical protein